MLKLNKTLLLAGLLWQGVAIALPSSPPPTPPPAVEASGNSAAGGRGERPFRVRLGVFGGAVMQKTQFELGAAWDFWRPSGYWRAVADLTLGMRPNEVSVVPMVGARFVLPVGKAPVEVSVEALAGVNFTVMRGGTGVALPARLSTGAQYLLGNAMGVGFQLSADFGPLISPFSAPYAALHATLVFAWGL